MTLQDFAAVASILTLLLVVIGGGNALWRRRPQLWLVLRNPAFSPSGKSRVFYADLTNTGERVARRVSVSASVGGRRLDRSDLRDVRPGEKRTRFVLNLPPEYVEADGGEVAPHGPIEVCVERRLRRRRLRRRRCAVWPDRDLLRILDDLKTD